MRARVYSNQRFVFAGRLPGLDLLRLVLPCRWRVVVIPLSFVCRVGLQ